MLPTTGRVVPTKVFLSAPPRVDRANLVKVLLSLSSLPIRKLIPTRLLDTGYSVHNDPSTTSGHWYNSDDTTDPTATEASHPAGPTDTSAEANTQSRVDGYVPGARPDDSAG